MRRTDRSRRLALCAFGLVGLASGCATPADSGHDPLDLGVRVAWGDLHVHSGLSNDGCERPSEGCADAPGGPASDLFANAEQVGLEFAAITDHGEFLTYHATNTGETYDTWTTAQERVSAADGGAVLPVLGTEWMWPPGEEGGHLRGGHKTVLFGATSACAEYRVGSDTPAETYTRESGWFEDRNPVLATTPDALWAAFDEAGEACGELDVVTFYHHGAQEAPRPVDWTLPQNAPDRRHENLFEVYSEHGASECLDPAAEGCDWGIPPIVDYVPVGSAQQALSEGYGLGFVANTDAHDARPGSWEDGPSYVADAEGPVQQTFAGGITGVILEGDLTRETLFRALHARRTWASSGPRDEVLVSFLGKDGRIYLPGDRLPATALPGNLSVTVPEETDLTSVDVLDASGARIAWTQEHQLSLSVGQELTFYVRIRLNGDQDRMWASPFFGTPRS